MRTRAWEAFQETEATPRTVSVELAQSWRRSKKKGVDPQHAQARFVDVPLDSASS